LSKIIIGIHGLGNKPPRKVLKKWWKQAIKEGLLSKGNPRLYLNFKMVYWAHVLHPIPLDPDEKDKKSDRYLDEPYVTAKKTAKNQPNKIKRRVLDYLEKQFDKIFLNEDLSLNFSSVTDIIIHHFFRDLEVYYSETCFDKTKSECYAKEIIRKQLFRILLKHKNKSIMLIAHSMGSIIAYDVLTNNVPDIHIDTFVTIGSPLGSPVIISKIVSEQQGKLKVAPKVRTPENVTRAWYNFSYLNDKVALDYNLSNDFESNSRGVHAVDFIVTNDYEINGNKNPHKSYGYLRTPELAHVIDDFLNRSKWGLLLKLEKRIKSLLKVVKSEKSL
jgi:hypothetical protein